MVVRMLSSANSEDKQGKSRAKQILAGGRFFRTGIGVLGVSRHCVMIFYTYYLHLSLILISSTNEKMRGIYNPVSISSCAFQHTIRRPNTATSCRSLTT